MKILITERQLRTIIKEARGDSKEDYDPENYNGINGVPEKLDLVNPKKADGGEYRSSAQRMRPDAAESFEEMEMAYYDETGETFTSANFTDGFRPYSNATTTSKGYGQFDIVDWDYFEETGDFKKRPKNKNDDSDPANRFDVAEPGTSNHGWGIAMDIAGKPQEWMHGESKIGLERRSEDFGWWWGENRTEPHHFKFKPELKAKADELLIKLLKDTKTNMEYCEVFLDLNDKFSKKIKDLSQEYLLRNLSFNDTFKYCKEMKEPKANLPTTPVELIPNEIKRDIERDQYRDKLYKELPKLSKKELRQKIKQLEVDGRGDLIPMVNYHLKYS